ncbi:MAG: histidine kinase N-terminal 7TM domain-containing protein [Chloroflexota bacterium]
MNDFFRTLLDSTNEILAAAIVIVATSLLLYNLTRNLTNRVARTSAIVLGCVTIAYVGDVLMILEPTVETFEVLLRLQWVGLAFIPAATYHLSDALLATTGLPSRGRRRRAVRLLYGVGSAFLLLSAFSNLLFEPQQIGQMVSLTAGPVMTVYVAYFIPANVLALINVWRARQRCLTRSTQRRMTYLLIALLMPSVGIFPYSILLEPGDEFTLGALALVNLGNVIVILMLLLLAYPLSFFGSKIPDRVVKAELLSFMLRGPATGMLALAIIVLTEPATEIVGVIGRDFMPFAVVATILLWQWGVDVALPYLERVLIYNQEDDEQLSKLQHLSERLLTRSDLNQLLEATLEAACDYLQVEQAFVAAIIDRRPEFVRAIGGVRLTEDALTEEMDPMVDRFYDSSPLTPQRLGGYWVVPLFSNRLSGADDRPALIGMMGIEAEGDTFALEAEERDIVRVFVRRAARTLDDMLLQTEIYAALEGLLPQIAITRGRADEVEYRPGRNGRYGQTLPERDQVVEQVHAALRHYWGGPGLTSSRLLELQVINVRLPENENNAVKALRDVLGAAIETLRPSGERDYKSPEWLLYNILTLRFIDNKKARETARRLYISEANLYRKQNAAIEAVADAIIEMEQETQSANT